jgi:formylglycine-generating enzyme required for sulfatase activity
MRLTNLMLKVMFTMLLVGCGESAQSSFPTDASLGDTWTRPSDGMVMVYVPAGDFIMGADETDPGAHNDEYPQHTVYLDAFWIDQTEVTTAMYARCVEANVCDPPYSTLSHYGQSYYGEPQYEDYPVMQVDWFDAMTYCEWVGQRLPTEAEWEKAARGTDGRTYPWGEEEINCQLAQYNRCGGETVPAGSYPAAASPYGALDMAGNVREWVSSLYRSYPYDSEDGREDLEAEDSRILRGGSWHSSAREARSSDRMRVGPAFTHSGYGFRCAGSP